LKNPPVPRGSGPLAKALPHVLTIPPYPPGRPIESVAREFGLDAASIVKLASNENPNGCSVAVASAIAAHASATNLYPDFHCYELQHAIARHLGVAAEQVLPAAGSSELISIVARAYLDRDRTAVVPRYSFHSYQAAVQSVGAQSSIVDVREWAPDLEAMLAAVTSRTHLVYLGSPNNPTGCVLDVADVERFVDLLPEHVMLVLDEAYRDFLDDDRRLDPVRLLSRRRNLLILRTFSKIYGLAGLRVGYCLGDAELLQVLRRLQLPFSVSGTAQVAAIAALGDAEFVARSQQNNAVELELMAAGLDARGLNRVPSFGNFILTRVGDGARVARELMRRGVIIRPVDNYGLPEWIRVSVGTADDNARFFAELDRLRLVVTPASRLA
jgi:histidinol-phosphate aminotransferase